MMANPFAINTAGSQAPVRSGYAPVHFLALDSTKEENEEKERNAAQNKASMGQEFSAILKSGNAQDMANFSMKYPEISEKAQQAFGFANEQTKSIAEGAYAKSIAANNAQEAADILKSGAKSVIDAGGNPQNMVSDATALYDGSVDMNQFQKTVAMVKPEIWQNYSNYQKSKNDEGAKFQQGTGSMSGYSFNPNDGTFSISPDTKAKIEEIKLKPELDAKDRLAINKEFTSLTKDTKLIRNTAADLEKLASIKNGPASIAMVFKFMKALDPTSVVREGEFATAENSAGVPENVRNMYNKVMEGGRLGDEQINQFVLTAKELANSAIDSSNQEVGSFLSTFEGSLPKNFKDSIQKRVPEKFKVEPEIINWSDL